MIVRAITDSERQEVLEHFLCTFDDIDPNAVPMSRYDDIYAPIIIADRHSSGEILGAALTCRSQVAVGPLVARLRGLPAPPSDYTPVLSKHSELDLMSVVPGQRNQGIGSRLVKYLERELRRRGVRIWFGHVTSDLDTEQLRQFYNSHRFKVTEDGQTLPPLLGRNWVAPTSAPSAFSFYKKLG